MFAQFDQGHFLISVISSILMDLNLRVQYPLHRLHLHPFFFNFQSAFDNRFISRLMTVICLHDDSGPAVVIQFFFFTVCALMSRLIPSGRRITNGKKIIQIKLGSRQPPPPSHTPPRLHPFKFTEEAVT